jgi:hypothetical protein
MAANPKYYHPVNVPRTIPVSFVGMNYARRLSYISQLLYHGIDVQVFGPGWTIEPGFQQFKKWVKRNILLIKSMSSVLLKNQARFSNEAAQLDLLRKIVVNYPGNFHRPVSDEKMISLYSESFISLGFLEVFQAHDCTSAVSQHLHLREFEAPMSGALYFTGWCNELSEFYEPDKEIVIYRNEYELLEKIHYYLDHEKEANKIREAGHRRALAHHTYQKRFTDLFTRINLEKR